MRVVALCVGMACGCDKAKPRGTPIREDAPLPTTTPPVLVPWPPPTSQTATDPPRPSFPSTVAGFAFGQTIAELRAACAEGRDGPTPSQLALSGSYAECPTQATRLDFTKPVTGLHLTGGKAVAISLTPNSYTEGLQRLSEKYGSPADLLVAGKWQPTGEKAARTMQDARWRLTGGSIYLMSKNGRTRILFISDLAGQLRNEGF